MDEMVWVFRLISFALYAGSFWLFWQILLVIKTNYMPMLTNGKLGIGQILSLIAGLVLLTGMVLFGPGFLAKTIQKSFNAYMVVMLDISQQVVIDVQNMTNGTPPVYTSTSGQTVQGSYGFTTNSIQPSPVPVPQGYNLQGTQIDPATGQIYNDPNAGGGGGIPENLLSPPTPQVMENPTPVIYPTIDPNTWQYGDTPPTPVPGN